MSTDADGDFLARLNRLRPTTLSLQQEASLLPPLTSESEDTPDDLIARFQKIQRGGATSSFPNVAQERDVTNHERAPSPTLEELLAEIQATEQDMGSETTILNADRLVIEARQALEASGEDRESSALARNVVRQNESADDLKHNPDQATALSSDELMRGEELDKAARKALQSSHTHTPHAAHNGHDDTRDGPTKETEETEEADEALQRILDEALLEEPSPADGTGPALEPNNSESAAKLPPGSFSLPSVPVDFPDTPKDFSLPSAPSTQPGKKPVKLEPKKDDDVETWCEICLADASVRCHGCDGELYCRNCWREGHTGESAGYEERTHKWERFSKPNANKVG